VNLTIFSLASSI